MPAFKRWTVKNAEESAIKALCGSLGISSLAARALAARGYADPEAARGFLQPDSLLEPPGHIADMEKAAQRINRAIEAQERIAVFGDYDVDGVTSTTLLCQYLQSRGAQVACSLPTRESSGYGLSNTAVDNLAAYGASLIVTVDNGISAYAEIAYAAQKGMDVIVCDHHLPGETLPPAYAVVDPLRADDTSSFKELAGVGVAFKLVCAVEGCLPEELAEEYGWLVALGTIADIMPLVGENRMLVKAGLEQLAFCENCGIRALCEAAGVDMEEMDAQTVAFTISPRINAAGRMGSAELALSLLLADDPDEAARLAGQLEQMNRDRQATEQEVERRIAARIDSDPEMLRRPVLVVSGEGLHAGVIGIACSRLVERYGKPVVLISLDGDCAKGSGRSVRGFSLYDAISACGDLLQKYGGHELAAGFTIDPALVEPFKERLFDYCKTHTWAASTPELRVDSYVDLAEISEKAVRELALLAPFGRANDEPVYAVQGAVVTAIAPLGERHTRLTLRQGGRTITGALFSVRPDALAVRVGDEVRAAFTLSIYRAQSRPCVSVKFRDIAPAAVDGRAFDSLDAYRRLCAGGGLDGAARALLAPTRQEVAYVYRKLRAAECDRGNLARVCAEFDALPLGKTEAVFDILLELGHLELHGGIVRAADHPEKKELGSSALFARLNGEQNHDETDGI